jgi:type IV secretory pathway TrbD component
MLIEYRSGLIPLLPLDAHPEFTGPYSDYCRRNRLTPVRRLGRRALLLFGAYTAVILAVVIAGFLGGAVGIWASVLWGAVLLGGLVLYLRRRSRRPQVDP